MNWVSFSGLGFKQRSVRSSHPCKGFRPWAAHSYPKFKRVHPHSHPGFLPSFFISLIFSFYLSPPPSSSSSSSSSPSSSSPPPTFPLSFLIFTPPPPSPSSYSSSNPLIFLLSPALSSSFFFFFFFFAFFFVIQCNLLLTRLFVTPFSVLH